MISQGIKATRELFSLTQTLPNLRTLILAGILGTLGAGLLNPIFSLYLESRGLDLTRIGLVFTVGSLIPILAQPVLGALSDRFSRRGFVIGVSLATSLLIPVFTLFDHPGPLAAILALKLILERSAAPVSSALVGDFAPKTQRASVFALMDAATNLMFVLALVGSSLAVQTFSTAGVFYLSGGFFLLSSLSLFRLEPTAGATQGSAQSAAPPGAESKTRATIRSALRIAWQGLVSPLTLLRGSSTFAGLFAYQLFFTFALDLFPVYLPLYAVDLGASPALVGPIIASSWLAYALVQPIGGRLADRLQTRRNLILKGLLGMVVCEALLGVAGFLPASLALPTLVIAWVLLAIPDGLFRPAAQALIIDVAPAAQRGEVLGALGSATALANVIAPLLYGWIAVTLGMGWAFLLSAGAFALAGLSMLWVREPAREAPAASSFHP